MHDLMMPHDSRYLGDEDIRGCPPNCPYRGWYERTAAAMARRADRQARSGMILIALPLVSLGRVIAEILDDYRATHHDSEDALVCEKRDLPALAEAIAGGLLAAYTERNPT
jgi:hypothetical protein